ncbi:nop14-like family domain-containing protein [Ditylenchus destructor]|nr:nop14-like family domain-containing protein [Ditylenchus destructor]
METAAELSPENIQKIGAMIPQLYPLAKFLEPRIEEHFNPDRSKKYSAGKTDENQRVLIQKLKKETRGATKELRMDAKYLARMQHEQGLKISRERIEKTKRILQSLQGQESEYKKRKAKKF